MKCDDYSGDWVSGPIDAVQGPIASVALTSDSLLLTLENGTRIRIEDHAQNCCEYRHVTCDDDVQSLLGGRLLGIDIKGFAEKPSDETHEVAFIEVRTTVGFITLCTHNEHNGYYGGFDLQVTITAAGKQPTKEE